MPLAIAALQAIVSVSDSLSSGCVSPVSCSSGVKKQLKRVEQMPGKNEYLSGGG